jgi:hypothetical protein
MPVAKQSLDLKLFTWCAGFGGYLLQEALRPYVVAGGLKLHKNLKAVDAVGYGDFILQCRELALRRPSCRSVPASATKACVAAP